MELISAKLTSSSSFNASNKAVSWSQKALDKRQFSRSKAKISIIFLTDAIFIGAS
ncbi:MAG: hypothetical protein Q8M03_16870 [Legionella sp.]|nr:hypothetical protein [Legionella sp.]